MRYLANAVVFLAACTSGNSGKTPDAGIPSCATYCTNITANCTTINLQYSTAAACMASCPHFPVGTGSDMSGDTLGCRVNHAALAMTDPTTHCVHAGPSGGGACGMPCEGFCSLVVAECPAQYPDAATCAATCMGFAAAPPYTAMVTGGNSLSCRIYHATAAAMDPTTHCPHTAMDGGGVCQ